MLSCKYHKIPEDEQYRVVSNLLRTLLRHLSIESGLSVSLRRRFAETCVCSCSSFDGRVKSKVLCALFIPDLS